MWSGIENLCELCRFSDVGIEVSMFIDPRSR